MRRGKAVQRGACQGRPFKRNKCRVETCMSLKNIWEKRVPDLSASGMVLGGDLPSESRKWLKPHAVSGGQRGDQRWSGTQQEDVHAMVKVWILIWM